MPITGTSTTIKVSPAGVNPTYNETILVLESTNIISDNFKWIFKLYKGESTDADYELISTLNILPNPDGYGVVDVHRHVENYITTDFYPDVTDKVIKPIDKSGLKWSFEIEEQFDNTRWQFDDNTTSVGANVGFRTNSVGGSLAEHPFETGDEVYIEQFVPFTHPEYERNLTTTPTFATLTYFDEYVVVTDIPKEGSTGIEGGIMTLVDTSTRSITQDLSSVTNIFYSFNGVLSFQGFRNWDASDYEMTSTSPDTTKFLTNIPRVYDVTLDDRVWLNGLQSATSNPVVFGAIYTDNGIYGVDNQYTATGQFFQVQHKIGPKDLMETTDTTLTALSGSLPAVDANTTFIAYIQSGLPAVTRVSETILLNIVDNCSKYESIRFFFMDRLGSYIPITFNKVSRTNISNARSNYKQNYGSYDSVSETWGYESYDRGTTTYDIVSTERVTCTSDWLTDEQVSMVIEMLGSPNVFIQDADGNYIAITITTTSFEEKKRVNDKLLNYTITFEYSQNNGSQRG